MSTNYNITIDKLRAVIDGKNYKLTSVRVQYAVNSVGVAEVTLAQGMSPRGTYSFNRPASFEKNFTPITIELYMQGQSAGIVLFRGFISSVSRVASRTVSGSYTGTVLNCTTPPGSMQSMRIQGYRYWGSSTDGKGATTAKDANQQARILQELNSDTFATILTDVKTNNRFQSDVVGFMTDVIGLLVEYISNKRYDRDAVNVHIMDRGRTVVPSGVIANSSARPEAFLLKGAKSMLQRSDALATLLATCKQLLYMNVTPSPCGKLDIAPSFPWGSDPVATLMRSDILKLQDTSRLSGMNASVDAIFVPVRFASDLPGSSFESYPETAAMGNAGSAKVVSVPDWLSPWLGYDAPGEPSAPATDGTAALKTHKAGKNRTAEELDKALEDSKSIAQLLAKAFFNEVKHSSTGIEVTVPWYRLEFLDALGYLMEIEQPNDFGGSQDESNLFGYLAGVTFQASSTTGGSTAALSLAFSHVRSDESQDANSLDEHPIYEITDPVASQLSSFLSKKTRLFTRSKQISLEGGSYANYLTEAKEQMDK